MSKALTAAIITLIVGFAGMLAYNGLSQIGDNKGYEPDQPIAFSHKVHAGDNKISCLYCHFGAEKSRHAGIPPANVCMNCHSNIKKDSPEIKKIVDAIKTNKPIEWTKVHKMADFVYFNHAQHVSVAKVSCQTCHGSVEKMMRMKQDSDLTMGWCIDCHRSSDVVVHGTTKVKKVSDMGGADCARCHY